MDELYTYCLEKSIISPTYFNLPNSVSTRCVQVNLKRLAEYGITIIYKILSDSYFCVDSTIAIDTAQFAIVEPESEDYVKVPHYILGDIKDKIENISSSFQLKSNATK